jgi:hypothetical protein
MNTMEKAVVFEALAFTIGFLQKRSETDETFATPLTFLRKAHEIVKRDFMEELS